MQEYQIETEEAALELIENLTEQAWAEIEEKDIFGIPVSAQTVSKTTAFLEEELRYYQERELSDDVEFPFLDGIGEKVREIGVERKVMLCAFGIHSDSSKEILSFRMADSEDLASSKGVFGRPQGKGPFREEDKAHHIRWPSGAPQSHSGDLPIS